MMDKAKAAPVFGYESAQKPLSSRYIYKVIVLGALMENLHKLLSTGFLVWALKKERLASSSSHSQLFICMKPGNLSTSQRPL